MTIPSRRPAAPAPVNPGDTRPRRPARRPDRRWWISLAAAGVVSLGLLLLAGLSGYASGLQAAQATLSGQSYAAEEDQFQLGVDDLLAGRYDLAVQRFEYVLSLDPGRADAAELLERALEALEHPTRTPGPTATPITPTPTLDLASLDGLFSQAQSALVGEDWSRVIEAGLQIRARDPQFRRDELNGLLGQALRSRGVQRILAREFELGMYDLALASRFGPLDGGAASWQRTGAFYVFANSYFGLDWFLAADNFAQLCAGGLWDSCLKYARAAMEVGHILLASQTPCAAATQYEASLRTRSNPPLEPTAAFAFEACQTQIAPTSTGTPTETPSPTGTFLATTAAPSATSGPSATVSPTIPGASATPTQSPSPSLTPTPSLTPASG